MNAPFDIKLHVTWFLGPHFLFQFSISEAPKGLDKRMFLNLMYRIHLETEWPAQRIIEAFDTNEGHYAVHPSAGLALDKKEKKRGGCIIL